MSRPPSSLKISSPKLRPFFEARNRYIVARSGRGLGKSYAVAQSIIIRMMRSKIFVFCGRYIQKSIKDSVYKLLKETADRMGVTGYFSFYRQEIICRATASVCVFGGLRDNLTSLKGLEGVDLCWIEEAECVTDEAWDFLIPSIRKAGSQIFVTFNPRYKSDATWVRFVDNSPPDNINISLDVDDNRYFPEALKAERENDRLNNPRRYRWVWCGEPIADDDVALIPSRDVSDALQRIPVVEDSEPVIMAVDPALEGNDSLAIVVRKGAQILSITEKGKTNTAEAESTILDSVLRWQPAAIIVDTCGLGMPIFSHCKAAAPSFKWIGINPGQKPNKDRYLNKRAELWDSLREWIHLSGSLRGFEHIQWEKELCPHWAINQQGKFKLESKEEMKKRGFNSPNIGDALAYSMMKINTNRYTADREYNTAWHG